MSPEVQVGYLLEDGSFHVLTIEPEMNGGHVEVFTKLIGGESIVILPASGGWQTAVSSEATLFGGAAPNPVLTELANKFGCRSTAEGDAVGTLAGRGVFFTVNRQTGELSSLTSTEARLLEDAWFEVFRQFN